MKCCKCKEDKNEIDFYKNKSKGIGINNVCILCQRFYNKDWYNRNKDRLIEKSNKYRTDNPIKRSIYSNNIKDIGNLYSEFSTINCMICGIEGKLVVDHNHSDGAYRGMLCSKCNSGLGMFNDNIGSLKNAIIYLNEKNKA